MDEAYCLFGYQYRDASNYKVSDEVMLAGDASNEARALIEAKLNSDGLFVPEFVELQPLQRRLNGFPTRSDHIWHEYLYLRSASREQVARLVPWGKLSQLLSNFENLAEWESYEMLRRIGLLLAKEPYKPMR